MFKSFLYIFLFVSIVLLNCRCNDGSTRSKSPAKPIEQFAKMVSGFSIKGVGLVATTHEIDSNEFINIRNINANAIAIMPYGFCSTEKPSVVYNSTRQWWGETDAGVQACIKLAKQNDLLVMIKPHLWIQNGIYSGKFELPGTEGWDLWESSYLDYILHFARIGDSLHADLFCIGTELGLSIKQRPLFWNRLIDSVKKIYHGRITYAANWDDYDKVSFWKQLDFIGIDAYFPLVNNATPSKEDIVEAWNNYLPNLEKISEENNRTVLFTEYGYRNVDACTAEPWKEDGVDVNDVAQANAYEGFYRSFANKKWFAGGFVWKWYGENYFAGKNKIDFTPQGKSAENIIRKWYAVSP
ncbi:MAG: hypothetical protein ABI861_13230 [Panacibacter sp.]